MMCPSPGPRAPLRAQETLPSTANPMTRIYEGPPKTHRTLRKRRKSKSLTATIINK